MNLELNTNNSSGITAKIQSIGRFLSGMVMPNIGAFIVWGLITALFIPVGWTPNSTFALLVGPMLKVLLPILLGYTGGRTVGGIRGGVVGAVATFGIIMGSGGQENLANGTPMFLGAMLVGPLGGYLCKKVSDVLDDKIPAGFEMLINNFADGILGLILACLGLVAFGPIVSAATNIVGNAVQAIVNAGLLPLASIIIEPAKILFLNNALNHGIFTPLGTQQVTEAGKSIFFMLETNPGPGLGLLLAYLFFSKGTAKASAPGAILIHFFGGIHEIYFPYVLMNPILLLAVIAGGMSGVLTNIVLHAGLIGPPAPGSIFAYLIMAPKGALFQSLAGVVVAATVSFLISSVSIKRNKEFAAEDLNKAQSQVKNMKASSKGQAAPVKTIKASVNKIVFACDAGMGSSAMGATMLKKKLKKAGIECAVSNASIEDIPGDTDIVITHSSLTSRAKAVVPNAEHVSIQDFIQTPAYDLLVERITKIKEEDDSKELAAEQFQSVPVLKKENIKLGLKSVERDQAIKMAGQLLVDSGYVEDDYIDAMLEREKELTTYIGQGVAIPHGVGAAKKNIKKTGISILQFPEGVSFGDDKAYLVIGIAGLGNEHLKILANLSELIEDIEMAKKLWKTDDLDYIYQLFSV